MTPPAPGVRSKPPPGSHRIKNIIVTPDGKLKVEYEEVPE